MVSFNALLIERFRLSKYFPNILILQGIRLLEMLLTLHLSIRGCRKKLSLRHNMLFRMRQDLSVQDFLILKQTRIAPNSALFPSALIRPLSAFDMEIG